VSLRLTFGPWGETLEEIVAAAQAAENGGFERVWVAELHRSAFVPAAAIAAGTKTIGVGTGIAWAFARSEMVTALHALDLDDLSEGRFVLGLGTGVKRLIEDWHHGTFGKPVTHIKETVELIRRLVATAHTGQPIDVDGDWVRVSIRNYERPFVPRRTEIPIYLASVGPLMTRTAGEIADGWLAHELGSPRYLEREVLPNLEEGLRRAGRPLDAIDRVVSACCVPHTDGAQARRWAAGLVAFYASVRTYTDFFAYHGFEAEARRIQDRFRASDFEGMVDACPDQMVDAFTFAGTFDEVRERLGRYEGLADAIKLTPPTHFVDPEVTRLAQTNILELFSS
jgi:probable F420-dependent oxidoreductase